MGSSPVRVEIDERPLRLTDRFATDYVSRLVRCALQDGARATTSDDGTQVRVEPVGSWPDGRPVAPQDLIEVIAAARQHPLWRLPLAGLRSARVCDDQVVLQLAGPNRALAPALRAPELAPVGRAGATNGPYVLSKQCDSRLVCLPNPGRCDAKGRSPIEFVVNRDVDASLSGFSAGAFDVTCNTGFPFSSFADWRDDPALRVADSGIWIQLEFADQPAFEDRATRAALCSAVDLRAVCESIGAGLVPAEGFGPAALGHRARLSDACPPRCALSGRVLTVAYSDYYPNRALVDAIADAWRSRLGIECTLVCVPFGRPVTVPHHVRLTLSFAHYDHPVAPLSTFIPGVSRWADGATARRFGAALQRVRSEPAECRSDAVSTSLDVITRVLPCMPVATLRSVWLQREEVGRFHYAANAIHDFSAFGCT